jgi:hypothetical protein
MEENPATEQGEEGLPRPVPESGLPGGGSKRGAAAAMQGSDEEDDDVSRGGSGNLTPSA